MAGQLVLGARRYATLDDLDVLDATRRDPELLRAMKRAIDRERTPGDAEGWRMPARRGGFSANIP